MKYNKVTVIPGDGIGPEIMASVIDVIDSLALDIEWDYQVAGKSSLESLGQLIPDHTHASIKHNKIVLKGPIETPIAKGFRSINVALRKKYDLYRNIRPVKTLMANDDKKIDLVIFRENTEGLYIGDEVLVDENTIHAIKKVTTSACERIIEAAFSYANVTNRKKVTLVHKANILKLSDGHFLNIGKKVAKEYPEIEFEDIIVDNMCLQLVQNPNQFDVIVTQNLYGDILSDLCAGLVGGLGMVPGANIGDDIAIFEAVHGTAPDIANKNIANPIALLLSSCMMLEYIGHRKASIKLKQGIYDLIANNQVTKDLNGSLTTSDFTKTLIRAIKGR